MLSVGLRTIRRDGSTSGLPRFGAEIVHGGDDSGVKGTTEACVQRVDRKTKTAVEIGYFRHSLAHLHPKFTASSTATLKNRGEHAIARYLSRWGSPPSARLPLAETCVKTNPRLSR